jgi:chromate transporter
MDEKDYLKENLIEHEENKLSIMDVFKKCLYLGLISFGGPMAHIGIFEQLLVNKHKYISRDEFLQLLSLCKVIPGPTSSQLLTAIATVKTKSLLAGIISFLCFNVPGFLVMLISGYYAANSGFDTSFTILLGILGTGLSQSAVAIIFQAAKSLTDGIKKSTLHLSFVAICSIVYYSFNSYISMIILMLTCGLICVFFDKVEIKAISEETDKPDICFIGTPALISFIVIFIFIHFLYYYIFKDLNYLLMSTFYRIGSLIIGGGHVVIPMVISEFSAYNLIKESDVLNSFTIVSLLPGPMFNLAAYIGTLVNGIKGGILSWFFIFLSGMLLMFTMLGYMNRINKGVKLRFFLSGVSSAAIGFILATALTLWYQSCWKNTLYSPITGTLNVVISFYLFMNFPSMTPFILLMGAVYSYVVTFYFKNMFSFI